MMRCRGCGCHDTDRVLDLGHVPAADDFPLASTPVSPDEAGHPLAMELCRDCGLAQLAEDDTTAQEPRGLEPQALRDQAVDAVRILDEQGWLIGHTAIEFGSPHGGSWLPLLTDRGFRAPGRGTTGDVVIDCFGIMHEADQHGAFEERAAAVAPDGTLLVQFHSLHAIVQQEQWNALRHKHFAYYSLTALIRLLAQVGMHVVAAWEFPLYGGTVLVAATRSPVEVPSSTVRRILRTESAFQIESMTVIAQLQESADRRARSLRSWLESAADAGVRVHAYGASSRAVALLHRAEVDRRLIAAVADASEAKQGRRMPGTDIPVISPAELVAAQPGRVLLTLPDLFPEVRQALPDLEGRWVVDWADDNTPHRRPGGGVQQPESSAART